MGQSNIFCLDIGSHKIMCKRTGSVLSCTTWHVDERILHKVANKLGVTLYTQPSFEIIKSVFDIDKSDKSDMPMYEMSAEVLEWSTRVNNYTLKLPAGISIVGMKCQHEWELVQLFTSSYSKCTKCGVEQ